MRAFSGSRMIVFSSTNSISRPAIIDAASGGGSIFISAINIPLNVVRTAAWSNQPPARAPTKDAHI